MHHLQVRRHLKLVWFAILKNNLGIKDQWLLPNLVKNALSAKELKFYLKKTQNQQNWIKMVELFNFPKKKILERE